MIEKEQLKQTISNLSAKIESLEAQLAQTPRPRALSTISAQSTSHQAQTPTCFPLVPLELPPPRPKQRESAETQTPPTQDPSLLQSQLLTLSQELEGLRTHCTQTSVSFASFRAESERVLGHKCRRETILHKQLTSVVETLDTLVVLKASQKQCLPVVARLAESARHALGLLGTR